MINSRCKIIQGLSDLPDVTVAINSFLQPVTLGVVSKQLVDGYTQEVINYVETLAVKQPLSAEALAMKPEGERSWQWYTIHATPDLVLNTDDVIKFGDKTFTVMAKYNYSEYGYVQYEVIEGYERQ